MLTHRWSWPCFALLTLIAAGNGAAAQAPAPLERDAAARRAFEAGREAYDRGRFAEALGSFEHAYALSPKPILLYNIGRAAEAELQTERAISAYEAYLAALHDANNREFVEARLAKLRQVHEAQQSSRKREPASNARSGTVEASPTSFSDEAAGPAAERGLGAVRLHAGVRLGVGGEWEAEYDELDIAKDKRGLGSTVGFQFGASQFWRYVGIGGELRINMFKVDDTSNRLKTLDLVALPRGGYRLETFPLELYGALPIGMSIPLFDDDARVVCTCGALHTADFKIGLTIGWVAGATYFLSDQVGINLEVGWLMHRYSFVDEEDDKGQVKIKQGNLLTVNGVFAL